MRWVVGIVAAALIVGVVLGTARNFREIDPATERTPYAGDFLHEWTGGWTWRSGERLRLYDPAYADEIQHDERLVGFRLVSDGFLPMVYPPVYYAAVSPLAALPYRTAAWVWAALTLGAFAVTAALLARAVAPGGALAERVPVAAPDWDRFRNVGTMAALPAAVAFLPFAENLVTSQKGTFVLLVWTATLLALLAGRPLLAGLAFGLLAVKPQLAFVLVAVMAVKRQWAFVAGVGATTGVLAALSVLPDPELARRYVECVRTIGEQIRLAPRQLHRMHGIYGFFTTLLGGVTPAARWLAAGVWTATVIATLAVLRGPLAPGSSRFVVQYCALAVATVLLTPNVVHYDLTLLLLPLFVLGWMLGRGAFPGGRGRAVLWGLVALYVACGVGPPIARATGFQPTFPVLVTLLVLLRAETIERRGAVG